MSKMVAFYLRLVEAGNITIDEVPAKWRDSVQRELEKKNA